MADKTVMRREDVESLAGKLEKFAGALPEQEQNVLGWLITRAQAATDTELSDSELESLADLQRQPLSTQLADSVGFGGMKIAGESEVTVAWKYKF